MPELAGTSMNVIFSLQLHGIVCSFDGTLVCSLVCFFDGMWIGKIFEGGSHCMGSCSVMEGTPIRPRRSWATAELVAALKLFAAF